MNSDSGSMEEKTKSQIVSDVLSNREQTKAEKDIPKSDVISNILELNSQMNDIKNQNEELLRALESSEAFKKKYSALFENNPCGLFILSEKGVINEVNTAGAALLDVKKSMLIHENFNIYISEESKAEFDRFFKNLFDTHCHSKLDVRLRKPDGSAAFVHIDAAIHEDKVTCYLSISIITNQQLVQESFYAAERKYRRLHESLMDGFMHVDMGGKIIECNDILLSWLGYNKTEIKNLLYTEITPENWHMQEEGIIAEQVMKRGFSDVYEKEYRRKDGSIFPVELRSILIPSNENENAGMWAIVRDISKRKHAENELKLNVETYRNLIEFAPDAFFQGNAVGDLIIVNNSTQKLTGYSKAELLKINLADLIPTHILKDKPLRYDLLKEGEIIKSERTIRQKSGHLIDIEMNSKRMPDGTHQCFARDITDRKRLQEVLRESELQYRDLADSISDIYFSLDNELKYTYCNYAYEKYAGMKASEIIGKTIYEVIPDIKGTFREEICLKVKETQKLQSGIFILEIGGIKKDFELLAYPSKRGIVLLGRDISDRIRAEKELTLFKSIIESSNAAISASDPDGKVIYVNPAFNALYGLSPDEAAFSSFKDYFPAEAIHIIKDKILPTLKEGKPWKGEIDIIHKNGHTIPIRGYVGSIQNGDRENMVLFSIMDDISEQKSAEKDRLILELLKGEESERKRIARDLHNHIGHIIVAIKVHIERAISAAGSETNKEQLERLLDKVIYALKEVRLVSSKLAGSTPTTLSLNQQIMVFLGDLEVISHLQIVHKIDPLPDKIPALLMRTVFGVLEEALTNIMKHSGASRVYIHVFVKNNRLYIHIRDNGKGIDPLLEHQGSGLKFMKEEAESIDGEIKIKSVQGKYCILKFNAPLNPS